MRIITKLLFILIFLLSANCYAAQRLEPLATFFENSGVIASSYKLYTYETGGTTPKTTYSDNPLTTAHDNPIVLNYAGRPAGDLPIYFNGAIKFVLKTASGGVIYSVDDYYGNVALQDSYYYLSSYADLYTAVATLEALSTTVTLVIDQDENMATKAENVDANSDITFKFVPGSVLTLGAQDLTINGPMDSGPTQCFSENSTGAVSFGGIATPVNPEWWGDNTTPGTTDMSAEIQSAIDALNAASGGIVSYVGETYLVDDLATYGDISHIGIYGETTLKKKTTANKIMSVHKNDTGPSNPDDNEKNILIENIIFDGSSETLGFSEHAHNLNLNAVSNVLVQRCQFIHPQGDGIYLGSGNIAGERHNERVKFINNFFDGYDDSANAGRNAISVFDCVDLLISGNYITRTATAGMPGGIDVEPNGYAYTRLQNITIENNTFDDNSKAGIQIVIKNADDMTLPPKGFKIINNHFRNPDLPNSSSVIKVRMFNSVTPYLVAAADDPHGVVIADNFFDDHDGTTIYITGTKGTIVKGNTFNIGNVLVLGLSTSNASENIYDTIVEGNIFDKSGNATGQVWVGNSDILNITNNIFRDPDEATGDECIAFFGSGVTTTSSHITISNNIFAGTISRIAYASSHTLDQATNKWFGNTIPEGVPNEFKYNTLDNYVGFGDYNFGTDGGITAGTDFVLGYIPTKSWVIEAWYEVLTTFESAGADAGTIGVGIAINGVDEIVVPVAISDGSNIWDAAGLVDSAGDIIPDGTAGNATTKTTDERAVVLHVAVQDTTAGKIRVYWRFLIGN